MGSRLIKINDNARKLFKAVNGEKLLTDNKDFFYDEITMYGPSTFKNVEDYSSFAIDRIKIDRKFAKFRKFIAKMEPMTFEKNGATIEKKTTETEVGFVLTAFLRDMYLKDHPEIKY